MRTHITNIYGLVSVGAKAQNMVTDIAKKDLEYEELGVYFYPVESDSPEMLRSRLDGIVASVWHEREVAVIQSPTWNDLKFDESFMGTLNMYGGLKKVFFIQDVRPLMHEGERGELARWIALYNQADLIIAPSQNMVEFLRSEGLNVEKVVIQKMWDYVVSVAGTEKPPFRRVINLAGNPNMDEKYAFAREWKYDGVQLAITANGRDWAKGKNIRFLGGFSNDNFLVNVLRKSGGFGLVWSENPCWREYMKMNVPYMLSAYLAAGIPVIVPVGMAEQDVIIRKKLGLVVGSLDEAAERIGRMEEAEYRQMAESVDEFAYLLREGYFTRKALTDAVFKLFDD